MGWRYDRSCERVKDHIANMGEIEVERLVREMDLENLSETVCRQIYGAHVYGEIRNLSALVKTMTDDADRQRLIQATHLYQREVARIVDAVGGVRIHFQGARAHALIYRPIRDGGTIASHAVLLQLVLDRFGVIFSAEFSKLPELLVRSGSDLGEAIGTRNGT
jgi:class 3 adenylate cyclase